MNGAHVKGMSNDEVDMMSFTEIGHPVPAMHAFNAQKQIVQEWRD
jgi:hypothetical protein